MFGRVGRAVRGERPAAYAVLRVYHPETVASALAIGMGTASLGSGAALARYASGRQVSAVAEAVTGVMDWGRREQRRFLRLPNRVLAVVTDQAVELYEWSLAGGKGQRVATWPAGGYAAEQYADFGQVGVRVVVDGKVAVLSGARGPHHPAVRPTIRAIVARSRRAEAG